MNNSTLAHYEVQDRQFTSLTAAIGAAQTLGSVVFEVAADGARALRWHPGKIQG